MYEYYILSFLYSESEIFHCIRYWNTDYNVKFYAQTTLAWDFKNVLYLFLRVRKNDTMRCLGTFISSKVEKNTINRFLQNRKEGSQDLL